MTAGVFETGGWWGLAASEQVALRWLVNHGGTAYASDSTALRALGRAGHATYNTLTGWEATDTGRALYASRDGNPGGAEATRRTTARAFEDAALSTRGGAA